MYNDEKRYLFNLLKCNSWHADHVKLHDDLYRLLKSLTNNIIVEQGNLYYFIIILGRQCEKAWKDANISNEYNKIYHCNILNVANKDLIMTFIQYHISDSSVVSHLEISLDNIKNRNWHNKNRTV